MPLVETSASDSLELLDIIANFAGNQAFTVNWNTTANDGQVGLSIPAHNFYCAFGRRVGNPSLTRDMIHSGGTVTDVPFYGTLANSFSATQTYAGGHPGAPGGSTVGSANHVITNDWAGSFPSVRLFSNPAGDYVHVVAQTGPRFSHMSFGLLDSMGFSGDRIPYLTGLFYEFWERVALSNGNYGPNRLWASQVLGNRNITSTAAATGHHYPFSTGRGNSAPPEVADIHMRLPSNVINNSLFPGLGGTISRDGLATVAFLSSPTASESWPRLFSNMPGRTNVLPSAIGRPLFDIPAFLAPNGQAGPFQMLGRFPDVRLVWMDGLSPAQVIEVDNEQWMVFPMKQKGPLSALGVEPGCNTWDYGFAYRVHPS